MTRNEITAWAEKFWLSAGHPEEFPRSLESAVAWALPLALVKLPRLGLATMRRWLDEKKVPFEHAADDRPLRACLLARAGRGVVFLDGSDPEDERRFSVGHEVAHFVTDYLMPREKAFALLGEAGRDLLDGKRPPTPEERLGGVLRGVEVRTFTHLMGRSEAGEVCRLDILEAEDSADLLALELLAPCASVLAWLEDQNIQWRATSAFDTATQALMRRFGLPASVAKRYGQSLVMSRRAAQGFRDWLGV